MSVYTSDMYAFLIHIRFCSFCLLLRRKVLACSTYLLAIMTDHPCRDLLLCTCAVYRITILTGCAYRHTRSRPVVGVGDLLYRRAVGDNE